MPSLLQYGYVARSHIGRRSARLLLSSRTHDGDDDGDGVAWRLTTFHPMTLRVGDAWIRVQSAMARAQGRG